MAATSELAAAATSGLAAASHTPSAVRLTIGTLARTPDPYRRVYGDPNWRLPGAVMGFRMVDALAWATPAGEFSPVGAYVITETGLTALNDAVARRPAAATALAIWPLAQTYTVDAVRDLPDSYVYDRNFEAMPTCPSTDLLAGTQEQDGDSLTREWSRVRSRPNLANCVTVKLQNDCSSF